MSVVRYPESMNSTDLQIWDNAAFDNGESEDSSAMFKSSWPNLKPVLFSSSESLDSFSSKENQNPQFENNRLPIKSHLPSKSIHHQNGRGKSTKTQSSDSKSKSGNEEDVRDDGKNIDLEIEEIEKEISRLSSRLEALRTEKAEKFVKTAERRGGGGGRVVPAKFMEQKQSSKNGEEKKKVEEEAIILSSKVQTRRRGLSIGPLEVINGCSGARRGGMSLGPLEISAGAIAIAAGKQQESAITPIQAIQNRRKSCFWKLQNIEEEEEKKRITTTTAKTAIKERRRRSFLSISPKTRKPNNNNGAAIAKIQASRKAATTVGSRKTVKREDSIVNSIQPKKLFIKDGEKEKSSALPTAATNKKPLKLPGRIVASRYNQGTNQVSAMRKRSLPENNNDQEEDENKRFDKKRSLSAGKSRPTHKETIFIKNSAAATEGRVKKRWEIPPTAAAAATTTGISVVTDLLPSIRTTRCLIETPRDSGPAKRVADLVGKKSYFSIDEDLVCQALNFSEEDEEEEEK